jgi:3-hydroxybutyryl-CoA dehydrogenase
MKIEKVAIFGGGNTGGGLAKSLALSGVSVVLVEKSRRASIESQVRLEDRMDHEISKYGLTVSEKRAVMRRIQFTPHARDADEVDLFIESVPEIIAVKTKVLHQMERVEPDENRKVKLANCAAIAISDIQAGLAAPSQVIGFHVLPPADQVPLVELVKGLHTTEETLEVARKLARRLIRLRSRSSSIRAISPLVSWFPS